MHVGYVLFYFIPGVAAGAMWFALVKLSTLPSPFSECVVSYQLNNTFRKYTHKIQLFQLRLTGSQFVHYLEGLERWQRLLRITSKYRSLKLQNTSRHGRCAAARRSRPRGALSQIILTCGVLQWRGCVRRSGCAFRARRSRACSPRSAPCAALRAVCSR